MATYCTLTGVDVENTKHAHNRKLIAAVQSLPVLELDTTTALCPLVVVVTNSSNPIAYMLPNDSNILEESYSSLSDTDVSVDRPQSGLDECKHPMRKEPQKAEEICRGKPQAASCSLQ